jgi:hypothetical protein
MKKFCESNQKILSVFGWAFFWVCMLNFQVLKFCHFEFDTLKFEILEFKTLKFGIFKTLEIFQLLWKF